MFGTNPIRKQELSEDGSLAVTEMFDTIQGEGPNAGRRAIFIRLMGCNLQCSFCDTDFESGKLQSLADIEKQLDQLPRRSLYVVTGGEPFRQNIIPLVNMLLAPGVTVQIETAGTLWLDNFPPRTEIVVSPKTGKINPNIAYAAIAWKYIIQAGHTDPIDGLPTQSPQTGAALRIARPRYTVHDKTIVVPHDRVYLQPCDDHDPVKNQRNVREVIRLSEKFGYRISLQLHKILNLP